MEPMHEVSQRCGLQLENADEPFEIFGKWMDDAKHSELNDPNAMSLATATPEGFPSVRIVLCKGFGPEGFKFYTNAESRKGEELRANDHVALCFHWKSRQRQVRIQGIVTELSDQDADNYFHRRHRMSQIGAWASQQSRPLDSRETLEARTAEYEQKFPAEVPRPDYWKGFLVTPDTVELWHEREFRLHDRFLFTRDASGEWSKQRLYP
jgi:pyridoxamine 5'-phosphate oxidase